MLMRLLVPTRGSVKPYDRASSGPMTLVSMPLKESMCLIGNVLANVDEEQTN